LCVQIFFFPPRLLLLSLYGVSAVSAGRMVSVCPVWQYGQSSSVFTFSTRGVVDFADAFLLVSDFQSVFRRGSSSSNTSTTKSNIYEDCLFKRGGFPCPSRLARKYLTILFPPLQLPTTDYGCTQFLDDPSNNLRHILRYGNGSPNFVNYFTKLTFHTEIV
jgi:hypothetical protein